MRQPGNQAPNMVQCCVQLIVIGLICGLTFGSPHERYKRSFGDGLIGIFGRGSSRQGHGYSQGSNIEQEVSEVEPVKGSGRSGYRGVGYGHADGEVGSGGSGRYSQVHGGGRLEQVGASEVSSIAGSSRHEDHGYHGIGHVHHGHGYHGHDHYGHHGHGFGHHGHGYHEDEHVHGSGVGRGVSGVHEHGHGSGILSGILSGHGHGHHHGWVHGDGSVPGNHGGRGSAHGSWYHGISHRHGPTYHGDGGHDHVHGNGDLDQHGSVQEGISVVEHNHEGSESGTGDNRNIGQVQQGVHTHTHEISYHGVTQEGGSPPNEGNVQKPLHESGGLIQGNSESEQAGISGIENHRESGDLGAGNDRQVGQVHQEVRTYTQEITYQGVSQAGETPNDKDGIQEQLHESGGLVQEHSKPKQPETSGIEHVYEGDKLGTGDGREIVQVQRVTHIHHGLTQESGSPHDKENVLKEVNGSEPQQAETSGVENYHEGGELGTGNGQDVGHVQQGVRNYTRRVYHHRVTQGGGLPHREGIVQEQVHESGSQPLVQEHSESQQAEISGVEHDREGNKLGPEDSQEVQKVQQEVQKYVHEVTQEHGSSGSIYGEDSSDQELGEQKLVHGYDGSEQILVDEVTPDQEIGTEEQKENMKYQNIHQTHYDENDKTDRVLPDGGKGVLEGDESNVISHGTSNSKPQNISELRPVHEGETPTHPLNHDQVKESLNLEQYSISEVKPVYGTNNKSPHDLPTESPTHDGPGKDKVSEVRPIDSSSKLPHDGTEKPSNIHESSDSEQQSIEFGQNPINGKDCDLEPEFEGNGGLDHVPDSDQDQQRVSSVGWVYEESSEPGPSHISDNMKHRVTKVETVYENNGNDESAPDSSTQFSVVIHDNQKQDSNQVSSIEQVSGSDHPRGSGDKHIKGSSSSSTSTRKTVTTVEYIRKNDKLDHTTPIEDEEIYGSDKVSTGVEPRESDIIGQHGVNQVSGNGEIIQTNITRTYSKQVSQGSGQLDNSNPDHTQESQSGHGGVVQEVVETVVLGHLGGESGHDKVVQDVTRHGSSVLENVGVGQSSGGSESRHTSVVQEIISSHGSSVFGNIGMGQSQHGSRSGLPQTVQEVTRHGSNVLGGVGIGHSHGIGGVGYSQYDRIRSRHGNSLLGSIGLGHSDGGLGHAGIGRFGSHGSGILGQVGFGHSDGDRSGRQEYEDGTGSASSYRGSGGSYGTYHSRSGSSGSGLSGGLLGLG